MNHKKMLSLAAQIARAKNDGRTFFVGAVGMRSDNVMVAAYNGHPKFKTPEAHSEARLCRKLDRHATVWVARTTADGAWAIAKPCEDCQRAMRRQWVRKVYYTIGPKEFGCLEL